MPFLEILAWDWISFIYNALHKTWEFSSIHSNLVSRITGKKEKERQYFSCYSTGLTLSILRVSKKMNDKMWLFALGVVYTMWSKCDIGK